jgi:hypothetical protein
VRVRPIGRPQLGHKCAELSVFPPIMVQILTSKTHRAVMAVTVEGISRGDGVRLLSRIGAGRSWTAPRPVLPPRSTA